MRPTALVVGGAGGIGSAMARALEPEAWVVALDVAFPQGEAGFITGAVIPVDGGQLLGEVIA